MENVNKVIRIGDLVTLKTHPDFKGVVQLLYKKNYFGEPRFLTSVIGIHDIQYYASVSSIDANFKESVREFNVTVLKVIESY